MKKIVIASDHGGFELKEKLKEYLTQEGFKVCDLGVESIKSCDYPVYAKKLCKSILNKEFERGILVCSTGLGMQICANRFKGIRAVCVSDTYSARMSREHNNSNVLALGAKVVGYGLAIEILQAWLNAKFQGERHLRRIEMLDVD